MTRQEASRANGARSNGPATPEGKSNSSRNALKHGLSTNHFCLLENESEEAYKKMVDSYVDTLQPANDLEASLVEEMINCRWKLNRAEVIEATLLDLSLATLEPKLPQFFTEISDTGKLALAYRDAVEVSKALTNIERNIARLSRQFRHAHDKLIEIQDRRKSETSQLEPEPEPTAASPKSPENRQKIHVVQNEPEARPQTPPNQANTGEKPNEWDGK